MGQEFVKKTTLFSVVGTGPISSITQSADIAKTTFLSFLLIFFLFVAGRGFAYVR
jgi:hypothetical protein